MAVTQGQKERDSNGAWPPRKKTQGLNVQFTQTLAGGILLFLCCLHVEYLMLLWELNFLYVLEHIANIFAREMSYLEASATQIVSLSSICLIS